MLCYSHDYGEGSRVWLPSTVTDPVTDNGASVLLWAGQADGAWALYAGAVAHDTTTHASREEATATAALVLVLAGWVYRPL